MKTITLTCKECGISKTFQGKDIKETIAAIDAAKWHDEPEENGAGIQAHCPKCWGELDEKDYN